MVEVSCKEKIMGSMHLLTNSESKIAKYVLDNFNETLNYNVSELADKAGVSDASVVRFCKSLGYKGFQDFKISAAQDILPRDRYFNPSLEQNDDVMTICKKIFNLEMAALNRTFSLINFIDMEAACEAISKADKVLAMGSGGSLIVAKDMQHKLMKIGIQSFVHDDIDLQMMAASLLTEKDVAICISHSGSNRNILSGLKLAHDKGATTIALTGQGKTPIANTADIALYVASEKTMFRSESASTRIAQLSMLDSMVSIIAFKNYEKSYRAVQQTRQATAENKF